MTDLLTEKAVSGLEEADWIPNNVIQNTMLLQNTGNYRLLRIRTKYKF